MGGKTKTNVCSKTSSKQATAAVKAKPKVVDSQTKSVTKTGFVISQPTGTTNWYHQLLPESDRPETDASTKGPEPPDVQVSDTSIVDDDKPFLLVNQEEYTEHKACITHCRFNNSGEKIATADVDGVLKVWSVSPSPLTDITHIAKSAILSLDWTPSDRLILGTKTGSVRLYDIKDKKIVKEVMMDSAYPRVVSLACNPVATSFVCSAVGRARSSGGSTSTEASNLRVGRLAVWDLKTMKLERGLPVTPNSLAVNCSSFNHNGQLVITGASDGHIRLFDTRKGDCIGSWSAHKGEVYSVMFSADETTCFSMGSDGKFLQWSIHKTGRLVSSIPIHQGAAGPFVYTGHGGYRQVQTPKGKLFEFDPEGHHILTCAPTGAQIYKMALGSSPLRSLYLGGHRTPVVTVDWCPMTETRLCVTGSMDGRVRVSSVMPQ